ncbi:MAG: alpha-ketoglutarate-dependent dioxygenase AlkB [Cellvibrio sp.]
MPTAPIAQTAPGAPNRGMTSSQYLQGSPLAVDLSHGSLLVMAGPTQHHWLHQISKTRRPVGERINLTFRFINQ